MSKIESTAINDLIHVGRPLERDSDELAFDRPLGGPRRRIRVTTALPARELPTLAPRITPPAHLDPIARGSLHPPVRRPRGSLQAPVRHEPAPRRSPTPRVRRRAPRALAVAALGLATVAAFAMTYRLLRRRPAPATALATPVAVRTAPTVSPIAPPPTVAAPLVDVQLASEPAGATVTLIDDGHAMLLGTTPLSAALDPSRSHELLFALDGHAPLVAHVDPSRARELAIRFPAAEATPPPPPAHVRARHAKPHREARTGLLMISSKPPCEIHVDGKPTGLTTPQRAIELPAGRHHVTLVDPSTHAKQTFPVHIAADHPTKLIENLMK